MSTNNVASSSSSSPGVPSPTTSFASYLPHLTTALDTLTTHAAALPNKSDISFHRTLDRGFAKDLDKASERVLQMTERLLSLVEISQKGNKAKGKGKAVSANTQVRRRKMEDEDDVVDGFRGGVVGVVDGLLEDADSALDDLRGDKKKAAIAVKPSLAAAAGQKIPGPFAKSRERLPVALYHATDLTKPQLLFHDPVNNFITEPWKPSLTTKPHSMVPLDFVPPLEYDLTEEEEMDPSKEYWRREKEVRLRQHPYFYETRHLPYPTSMFIDSPPIPPKSFEETPFEFVDTPQKLEKMVEKLKVAKEIAVDLEHHQMRSFSGFTCLMQISTREQDWVIDTLALRREIREGKLGDVMTDPAIIKVFHGAESDIIWLQHDFDIYVVNLFDTYHACVVLNMAQRSLGSLLQQYCDFEADKRYQRADWRIRPLGEEMLHYARSDTHFLLFIYDSLRNGLLEQSSRPPSPDPEGNTVIETARRNPQAAMREVLYRSADTALKLYEREVYDEETGRGPGGWAAAGRKWLPKGAIDEEAGWIWRKLHTWRDRLARELDESPYYLMPNDMLKTLALLQGTAPILVRQAVRGGDRAPLAESRLDDIIAVIKSARAEFARNIQAKEVTEKEGKDKVNGVIKPVPAKAAAVVASEPTPVPDVWDAITVQPKVAPKSGLFGSTIKSSTAASPSGSANGKSSSALFGKTLEKTGKGRKPRQNGRAKEMSPGFQSVQSSIHGELEPKFAVLSHDDVDVGTSIKPLEPETVPFVPAEARKTTTIAQANLSSLSEPEQPTTSAAATKKVEKVEDGVVQVKKSKKQKKRDRVGSSSIANDGSGKKPKLINEGERSADQDVISVDIDAAGTKSVKKEKKAKKEKVNVQDIPEFDYANEPNLLDQPEGSGTKASGKKGKKGKKGKDKPQTGIGAVEIPTFGPRPAKDASQPKTGNKSGTFV
ncbi:hypothetical protein CI109_102493 [Kwoniella shandongensis]|uniref:Uncharacterized protein n=1 Tax=Kwoniella shandongensis TaxID=1734106 RepID=A0A5M6C0R4_9TREE|nr:uncharacterized protein CI109_003189 [Kwoniella shandongensis]KAA5528291.1 hypothetical protein CI109_003189 [Kwoniella shandongensis]